MSQRLCSSATLSPTRWAAASVASKTSDPPQGMPIKGQCGGFRISLRLNPINQ